MKKAICLCTLTALFALSSCKSYFNVTFLTNRTDIEIYVDDEYCGMNMVSYRVPKGVSEVTVRCVDGGREVVNRKIYVRGMENRVIEIAIPEDYKYSNDIIYKPVTK